MNLLFHILLSSILFVFSIFHLKKRQKYYNYLLPGWIIIILLFVYSVPAAILFAVDPFILNTTFNRTLSYESVLGCQRCFTVVLAASCFAGFFSGTGRGEIDHYSYGRFVYDLSSQNRKYKAAILILFLIAVALYIERWRPVGGVRAMLIMGRADALFEIQTSGGSFTRYDIFLFLSASLFVPYFIIKRPKRDKGFILFTSVLFLLFFLILLISGARLPVVSICLGSLALVFALNREWLKKRTKLIIIAGIIVYVVLNVFTFFRSDVFNIARNISGRKLTAVEILFPNETLTAYLSYDEMIQYPDVFFDNQFLKILPNSIRRFIGYNKYIPYSARLQDIRQSKSTLTVPLPIDLFFGVRGNLFFEFILAFFIFVFIEWLFRIISKKQYGVLLMMWMYLLSFYFIRTEAIAWFSRSLLLIIFGLPLQFFLKFKVK